MLDPTKINVCLPEAPPASDYDAFFQRSPHLDHTTPPEQREQLVRLEYARNYPTAVQGDGRCYTPGFMGYFYQMPHHAQAAWDCMKSEGISALPLFPFFHHFLDFADPYRKIAVLVEEEASPWQQPVIDEQDELLSAAGWTVYRIPNKVAATFETSILPDSMSRCPYGEFDDDDEYQRYLAYKPQLSTETIDGFFSWMKAEVYAHR